MKQGLFWLIIVIILILGYFLLFNDNENNPSENEGEEDTSMSFFITSQNLGAGANFGGLLGADAHCQALAENAGAENKVWKAYLSAQATESEEAVNAKDRIGSGPWYNAKGILIASNVEELHGDNNPISKEVGLDENGNMVNGRGDSPNVHDILTGSNADGTLAVNDDGADTTCNNWTSEGEGSAIVGHHDRVGINDSAAMKSWVSSHGSRGCSLENLNSTGGGGLIYCFAE